MSVKSILIINTVALAVSVVLIIGLGVLLIHAKKRLAENNIKLFDKKKQK
ncbi:MAG: hypothetical protein ACI4JY_07155 [Oscillospiraceae bacterium]